MNARIYIDSSVNDESKDFRYDERVLLLSNREIADLLMRKLKREKDPSFLNLLPVGCSSPVELGERILLLERVNRFGDNPFSTFIERLRGGMISPQAADARHQIQRSRRLSFFLHLHVNRDRLLEIIAQRVEKKPLFTGLITRLRSMRTRFSWSTINLLVEKFGDQGGQITRGQLIEMFAKCNGILPIQLGDVNFISRVPLYLDKVPDIFIEKNEKVLLDVSEAARYLYELLGLSRAVTRHSFLPQRLHLAAPPFGKVNGEKDGVEEFYYSDSDISFDEDEEDKLTAQDVFPLDSYSNFNAPLSPSLTGQVGAIRPIKGMLGTTKGKDSIDVQLFRLDKADSYRSLNKHVPTSDHIFRTAKRQRHGSNEGFSITLSLDKTSLLRQKDIELARPSEIGLDLIQDIKAGHVGFSTPSIDQKFTSVVNVIVSIFKTQSCRAATFNDVFSTVLNHSSLVLPRGMSVFQTVQTILHLLCHPPLGIQPVLAYFSELDIYAWICPFKEECDAQTFVLLFDEIVETMSDALRGRRIDIPTMVGDLTPRVVTGFACQEHERLEKWSERPFSFVIFGRIITVPPVSFFANKQAATVFDHLSLLKSASYSDLCHALRLTGHTINAGVIEQTILSIFEAEKVKNERKQLISVQQGVPFAVATTRHESFFGKFSDVIQEPKKKSTQKRPKKRRR